MASQEQGPPVLIDTPVWKDYFRREERTFSVVNGLMDAGRICCLHLVVAELLHAAKSEREMKVFQDFTQVFPVLREPPAAWVDAARLAFKLRRKGGSLCLRDCYVALMAKAHGVLLYTTNQALHRARRAMGLNFFRQRMVSR